MSLADQARAIAGEFTETPIEAFALNGVEIHGDIAFVDVSIRVRRGVSMVVIETRVQP